MYRNNDVIIRLQNILLSDNIYKLVVKKQWFVSFLKANFNSKTCDEAKLPSFKYA